MNRQCLQRVLFVISSAFLISSCATVQKAPEKDLIEDVMNSSAAFIANKYYDFNKKRVIGLSLEVKSNFEEEPAIGNYLYARIKTYIEAHNQFKLLSTSDLTVDCIVDIHLIKTDTGGNILVNVKEPKNQKIIYSYIKNYERDRLLNNKEYLAQRDIFTKSDKSKKAKILIKAVSSKGDGKKEDDEVILFDRYSKEKVDSYMITRERGYSGYYPAEIECVVNGKDLKKDGKNIFFDGTVDPGTLEIKAAFRGAFYDAKTLKQSIVGDYYSKKFLVRVKENDNVEITINYIYTGLKESINVKAATKKEIEKQGKIEYITEIIEVFSL